ncbi:MAG: FecR domain-containing protein [Hellea sp.]|nr:FecR domain-containing protein [Hellea sp.]
MKFHTIGFIAILLMPSLCFGAADEDAGAIGEFSGSGVLERGRDVIDGGQGVGVQPMDTAVTAKGRMRIDFIDDTRVDITEHARLVIDDFVYDPNAGTGKLGLRATLGTVRYASGAIAKNSRRNVSIKTPSATIGVRGTDFVMVVDEIGGTMVTLLPSCSIDSLGKTNCVTGEISVESDTGFVIMNKAFQATIVKSRWTKPTKPLFLALNESDITNLLILRKKKPLFEEDGEPLEQMTDFLDIDFLNFDGLDVDVLTDSIKDIWLTEFDLRDSDYYLGELLHDMVEQLNIALMRRLMSELDGQNAEFFSFREEGYDPVTRITLNRQDPSWIFERDDSGYYHHLRIYVEQQYGYTINIQQQDEYVWDYRLGVGNNNIDIIQIK